MMFTSASAPASSPVARFASARIRISSSLVIHSAQVRFPAGRTVFDTRQRARRWVARFSRWRQVLRPGSLCSLSLWTADESVVFT
jgi:hypothetical protein